MTFNEIASEIAKLEGKKHQASVSDVREILAVLSDMVIKDPMVIATLIKNGERRRK